MSSIEISNSDNKNEKRYDPEKKYFCEKCQKDCFPKYDREIDAFLFSIFLFMIFTSFFLLILMIAYLSIRRFLEKKENSDEKLKAREQLNILGLVYPQNRIIKCIECNSVLKIEKDKGDLQLVSILFISIILVFLYVRFIIFSHHF